MEAFQISVNNRKFNITPKEDDSFQIESVEGELFVILPDIADIGLVWRLVNGIAAEELVQSIGEAIEEYEM
jgi:hypothetical protein